MVRARRNPPDGRSNNGGARQGQQGKPYPNRSDMRAQKIQTVPNQEYGKQAAQQRAMAAVPMAGAPAVPPGPPAAAGAAGPMQAPPPPPDLYRPTERPNEPVTHGLPVGAGAGPEAMRVLGAGNTATTDPMAIQIRALYAKYPSQELADLLADIR
ncbi:MAG: hypothetical protein LC792_15770 [Actinobacteria bacterium]|nr:hypothetical protein [Actinomycetota bacterium]